MALLAISVELMLYFLSLWISQGINIYLLYACQSSKSVPVLLIHLLATWLACHILFLGTSFPISTYLASNHVIGYFKGKGTIGNGLYEHLSGWNASVCLSQVSNKQRNLIFPLISKQKVSPGISISLKYLCWCSVEHKYWEKLGPWGVALGHTSNLANIIINIHEYMTLYTFWTIERLPASNKCHSSGHPIRLCWWATQLEMYSSIITLPMNIGIHN
jgi:hypothetical protein